MKPSVEDPSARRAFLKTAAMAGIPALLRGAPDSKPIKVGLVGCGGRGTGAASQALKADDFAELHAVADISRDRIDACLATLNKVAEPKVNVDPDRQFLGLDAYQKLIESGVDVVLLATPPGFRPRHVRAVVEAGKHLFCEKPIATDAPGVRSVIESAAMAKQKGTSLVTGFCWRYSNYIKDTFQQVADGAIGSIVAYYATYYTSPVKPMPPESARPAGMSDVQWQLANWYNFSYLSGDGLVEQAVHSVDKVAWAMRDVPPLSCVATGGRQIPQPGGNIFDHFNVNYEYANGIRCFVGCRQQVDCYNENSDYILGTRGACTIGRGPIPRISGEKTWRYEGTKYDMYQAEHDALFASIRKGTPINDGVWMATSTLLAIMGRMAAYTGQQITWEQTMNSQEKLFPDDLDWNGTFAPPSTPQPGVTKFL